MPDDSSKENSYTCKSCHAGQVSIQQVAYYTWLGGELITVPEFPAWICDMCGMKEYDQRALSWLNIILNPDTGQKKHPVRSRIQAVERPAVQPDL